MVAVLQAAWPKEWQKLTVALWVAELAGWPYDAGMAAAQRCYRTLKFQPSIAEYLEQLRAVAPRLGHPETCVCEGAGWVRVDTAPERVARCPRPAVSSPTSPNAKPSAPGSRRRRSPTSPHGRTATAPGRPKP